MPIPIRVDFFWVECQDATPARMRTLVSEYAAHPPAPPPEWTHDVHEFRFTDPHWDAARGLFFGTVWRVQDSDLPSMLEEGGGDAPLPIPETADLGNAMCFVYSPALGAAGVCYSHTGPRHPRLVEAIGRTGHHAPILISHIVTDEALEALRHEQSAKGVSFSLIAPDQRTAEALGAGANQTLDIMRHFGGLNVTVKVTVGRRGGRLEWPALRRFINTMRGRGEVGTLAVNYSPGGGLPPEWVNLLQDRLSADITVDQREGRRLDLQDCYRKLTGAFEGRRGTIQAQRGGGNDA